jgi:23S rRNA (guanosine2251-2'-O)-methyltransferase
LLLLHERFLILQKLKNHELNRLTPDEFKNAEKMPVIVVLDNIRSQHNIGSVFRTADAFRVDQIHLCGITATPPNREMHKTALGSTESVAWRYFPATIDSVRELKQSGYTLCAVEQTTASIPLDDLDAGDIKKLALIFGNEVHGVDEEVLKEVDFALEIPQFGTKHSLNISVAAGIVIWDLYKQVRKSQKM